MPTFCRHNRFIERCPICSQTLPGADADPSRVDRRGSRSRGTAATRPRRRADGAAGRPAGVRVRREARSADDGYRATLAPGLRSSIDALSLAEEIGFAAGRLVALSTEPPGLYGHARELASTDLELATWIAFLIAYLSPLEGEDPFAGIAAALARGPAGGAPGGGQANLVPDLDGIALGPRTAHDPARGSETLRAYLQWVARGGTASAESEAPGPATQASAFRGDPGWTPERRFERVFERLALPGFTRAARYELLVLLGRLGLYELRPGSLQLAGRGGSPEDLTTQGAKRVFGIADPLLLERRAAALADAAEVPVEALDLALANWAARERAALGFPADADDDEAAARAIDALGA
jgi:hypothetical protein